MQRHITGQLELMFWEGSSTRKRVSCGIRMQSKEYAEGAPAGILNALQMRPQSAPVVSESTLRGGQGLGCAMPAAS